MDKGMLKEATSSDDSPTPGYMLNEISKLTVANYGYCTELQEFLCSRIGTNNHNVKFKCLVIIKHVCRTGRSDFKKEMGKNTAYIKECLNFRGPPDPLRGDEIYNRVRVLAKEALDALFDSQMPVTTSAVASANRIQGMGGGSSMPNDMGNNGGRSSSSSSGVFSSMAGVLSNFKSDDNDGYNNQGSPNHGGFRPNNATSNASSSSSGGFSGPQGSASRGGEKYVSPYGSGMAGIGNSNFDDARMEKSWLQKAEDAAKIATSAVSSTVKSVIGDDSDNSTTAKFGSTGSHDYNFASNRGDSSAYGVREGSYNNNVGNNNAIGSNSTGGSWGKPGATNTLSQAGSLNGRFEAPSAPKIQLGPNDGSYERSKIEVLCSATGLKAVPPEDSLQDFLLTVPNLGADIVGSTLEDFINSEAWQSRVKALIVVEKMASAKGCDSHVTWWVENSEVFNSVKEDSKVAVRNQCTKTLKALGLDSSSIAATGAIKRTQTVANQQQASSVSLLDSFDPVSTSTTTTSQSSADSASDMFSGMSFRQSLGHQDMAADLPSSFNFMDSNSSRDSFNSPNVPPPPVPNFSPGGFHFIDASSSNSNKQLPSSSSSVAAAEVVASTGGSIFDAFDSLNANPSSSNQPEKENDVQSSPSAPVTVSAAFDFLSNEVSNAEMPDLMNRNSNSNSVTSPASTKVDIASFLSSPTEPATNPGSNLFGGMAIGGVTGGGVPMTNGMPMNMMPMTPQQQQQLMMMQQQQAQMMMMQQQQAQMMMMQQQQRMAQGGNAVPLYGAPSMNFNLANRKVIPTTGDQAQATGGAYGGQKKPDSFNFIGDAMKNEIKK